MTLTTRVLINQPVITEELFVKMNLILMGGRSGVIRYEHSKDGLRNLPDQDLPALMRVNHAPADLSDYLPGTELPEGTQVHAILSLDTTYSFHTERHPNPGALHAELIFWLWELVLDPMGITRWGWVNEYDGSYHPALSDLATLADTGKNAQEWMSGIAALTRAQGFEIEWA